MSNRIAIFSEFFSDMQRTVGMITYCHLLFRHALSNRFGFNINWASGRDVVVEATTSLSDPGWVAVATNSLTTDVAYYSDPDWTKYLQRAYRLRWQ